MRLATSEMINRMYVCRIDDEEEPNLRGAVFEALPTRTRMLLIVT